MAALPGLSTLPMVQETLLKRSVEPHVSSFDYFLHEGLGTAIANLDPVQVELEDGKGLSSTYFITPTTFNGKTGPELIGEIDPNSWSFGSTFDQLEIQNIKDILTSNGFLIIPVWIESADIKYPSNHHTDGRLMPRDCRLAGTTYSAPFYVKLNWEHLTIIKTVDDQGKETSEIRRGPLKSKERLFGRLPIMVRSSKCNLTRAIESIPKPGTPSTGTKKSSKSKEKSSAEIVQNMNQNHLPACDDSHQEYAQKIRTYMTSQGEEETEQGGYFVINGNEKVCRMLSVQRRNYPLSQTRSHYSQSGPNFSTHLVHIRSVKNDQSSHSNALHFLHNGDCTIRFLWRKQNYFLPAVLLLRAWKSATDREIYGDIVQGDYENTFITDRVEGMLRAWRNSEIGSLANTQEECLAHIGALFRTSVDLPSHTPDRKVGEYILRKVMFIHLDKDEDKFNLMIHMIRKVYSLASGESQSENADSPSNQEALLPGHLYLQILKEKLQEWLGQVKGNIIREYRMRGSQMAGTIHSSKIFDLHNDSHLNACLDKTMDVGQKIEMFLATGNLVSPSGLDMRQTSGFCIVGDRLNYLRFMAHFRGIHRGQFFTTLRTTDVRKLQPDNWGFLCPVHTPDGAPCGLLNHLAAPATVSTGLDEDMKKKQAAVIKAMNMFGMDSIHSKAALTKDHLAVILDGIVIGHVHLDKAEQVATSLRALKVLHGMVDPTSDVRRWIECTSGPFPEQMVKNLAFVATKLPRIDGDSNSRVPWDLEITLIKPGGKQHHGLYLFASPARLRRPVFNTTFHMMVESIGTFEQPYLFIDCPSQNRRVQGRMAANASKEGSGTSNNQQQSELIKKSSLFTHREIDPSNIFSEIGLMTPFSEFNQSPRNMYQCQMCKQTMGTPIHAYQPRADNKLYRILNPQTPMVRSIQQDLMDGYPHGANAVVAVISYTGYDMEDAMIINKSSYERGWGSGYVYKAETVDLSKDGSPSEGLLVYFNNCVDGDSQIATSGKGDGSSTLISGSSLRSHDKLFEPSLDWDGLPFPGQQLNKGDPWYVTYDDRTKQHTIHRYKLNETVTIEDVIVVGVGKHNHLDGLKALQKVVFKMRFRRLPMRGDKFASRAGQKGVLAQLWPHVDMPFSESGISPDLIINPNAFPSRMTIGMLIESMAGKGGALHGMRQDCTAFGYDEQRTATSFFGNQLIKAGYNYYGNEMMYSGITGEPFAADIFIGVVYYQRLRHMVGDKYQVRSTGLRNQLTRQPVKGRKKGGGIRFGEMERDSLLAHGVAHMLHDRLFNSSDRSKCYACKFCGSILSPVQMLASKAAQLENSTKSTVGESAGASKFLATDTLAEALGIGTSPSSATVFFCTLCQSSAGIVAVEIPFVFRYLLAELTAMNVRVSLDIE